MKIVYSWKKSYQMSHQNNFLARIFSPAAIGTLVSTMIGVIAGIYLTNYFSKRQLVLEKEDAMEVVFKELDDNAKELQEFHDEQLEKFQDLSYLMQWMDFEEGLIIPADSLDSFKHETEHIIAIDEIEDLNDGRLHLTGEFTLNFDPGSTIVIVGLSDIVWQSFRARDFLQVTDFNCISNLEDLYKFISQFNEDIRAWFHLFYNEAPSIFEDEESAVDFLYAWRVFIMKQEGLISMLDLRESMLVKCN